MMRTISLAHTVDLEAARLGLKAWEVVNLIESSIQRRYMRQGRTVHVRVEPMSETEPIQAIEAVEGMSGLVWVPIKDIRPPHPDVLQGEIEAYVKSKESHKHWWLADCKILSVENDYFLVEMVDADEDSLVGRTAVLPMNRVSAKGVPLQKGDTVWAVVKQKNTAKIDGAADWQTVQSDYVASRTDSIFLRMLLKKYWHYEVLADINSGAGLVVAPADADIGQIIGPKGQHIAKLKQLTGLSRIVVVRNISAKRPDLRLRAAIRQVAEVDTVKVRPPIKETAEWRLFVRTEDAKIVIGANGTNLRFISFLSGLKISHFVRDSQ